MKPGDERFLTSGFENGPKELVEVPEYRSTQSPTGIDAAMESSSRERFNTTLNEYVIMNLSAIRV